MPSTGDLAQVVIVTGGNAGIGFESALEFARLGADVVIAARDKSKVCSPLALFLISCHAQGKAAKRAINKQTDSRRAHYIQLDLVSLANVPPFVRKFQVCIVDSFALISASIG